MGWTGPRSRAGHHTDLHAEGVRLLVVEHDPTTSQRLRRGLTEEGYLVDSCVDGPAAVSRARAVGYDAVVLDVRLPGEDGFEVCRRLQGADA